MELTAAANLGAFMRSIRSLNLEIESIQLEQESALEEGVRSYIMTLKSPGKQNHEELFRQIRSVEGVAYLEGL